MARYKLIDTSPRLRPVDFSRRLLPGAAVRQGLKEEDVITANGQRRLRGLDQ